MVQILNRQPDIGELLGQSLGTGLAHLAKNKLDEISTAKVYKDLKNAYPNAEESQIRLAAKDPVFKKEFYKSQFEQGGNLALNDAYGSLSNAAKPQSAQQSNGGGNVQSALSSPENQDLLRKLGISSEQLGIGPQQAQPQQAQTEQPTEQKPLSLVDKYERIIQDPRIPAKKKLEFVKLRDRASQAEKKLEATERQFLTKEERIKEHFDRKEAQERQKEVDKETLSIKQDLDKKYKASKDNSKRLGRMETLVKDGKLNNPQYSALIDSVGKGVFGFGIDLSSLLTADTQEFNKISKDFLKGAKDIFGSRLTDTDLTTFLQTVPNSAQSDEAKLRVINNLRSFDEANKLEKKAMDEIIKENNGRRPSDLAEQIEAKIGPKLDELAIAFKGTPEEQSGFWGAWNKIQNYLG